MLPSTAEPLPLLSLMHIARGRRPSKHATKPSQGKVRLANNSGLRKLARAMRRGTVPAERMFTIRMAEGSAIERQGMYWNAHKRRELVRAC